jgi:ABC-type sugar transport system ATPase subunit
MKGIGKRFGPAVVLRDVSFDIYPGEVHLIAGENGAGKSTLIKILAGVYRDFEGEIHGAADVAVIFQELSLVPSMTVADNLLLGRVPRKMGFVRQDALMTEAKRLLDLVGLDLDPAKRVGELPIGIQQRIEIAKAIARDAKVIVMDEPTSALTSVEVEMLFGLIEKLKSEGRGVVYITHKMEEIERIADRVTVLRDGALVGTRIAVELPRRDLISMMVGREVSDQFPTRTTKLGEERLRIDGDVSLSVRAGEVLGIAGLQGSGSSELLMNLFLGRLPAVQVDGQTQRWRGPREAVRKGVALLTNDRKATGLVLSMSVAENSLMAGSNPSWRNSKDEFRKGEEMGKAIHLRARTVAMDVGDLSGGNQQKVALSKWIYTKPKILLLDEPTRGIDVGAKHEIYQLMEEWAQEGMAIVLISTELPELLALSDRIAVMRRGRLACILDRSEATPERVLEEAM